MTSSPNDMVAVVKPGQTYVGKQGVTYGAGASAETVGTSKICMNVMPMPPGASAKAHYHRGIETIAYMLEGQCVVYYGAGLKKSVLINQGEQCLVPADLPTRRATRVGSRALGSSCIPLPATRMTS